MSHFSAAAVTRSQTKQSEKVYRKLKVPDQIINEDQEALKQAQATDPNLDSIRGRAESGNIIVSRGLNRGETKFVRKVCCIDSSQREIRLLCNLWSLRVFVRKF